MPNMFKPIKHLFLFLVTLSVLSLLLGACSNGTGTSNAAGPAPTPKTFRTTVQTTDHQFTIKVTISPDTLGPNTFQAVVLGSNNTPATNVRVVLQTTMLDMSMGTDTATMQSNGQGSFSTQGVLTMSGNWQIRLVVHTSDNAIHEANLKFKTLS